MIDSFIIKLNNETIKFITYRNVIQKFNVPMCLWPLNEIYINNINLISNSGDIPYINNQNYYQPGQQ